MKLRTDLAVESAQEFTLTEEDGFSEQVSEGPISVSRIRITKQKAAELTGKPIGNYATIYFDGAFSDDELFGKAVEETASVLREFLNGADSVLAIGLGNAEMTADALGPKVIDRLIVSRHLKENLPEVYKNLAMGELSALHPGVVGQTGIETAELIRAAAETVRPGCLLIFDALASRNVKRLCATVQISDSGICPGSGVGNHRAKIDRESMGIPVISVGVPTVVDAVTLTIDALEKAGDTAGEEVRKTAEALRADDGNTLRQAMGGYRNNLVVTPQDIDALIDHTAKMISEAANKAVHGDMDRESIDALSS